MKFLHLADLHIGKRLNEFSFLEEQEYLLKQIVEKAQELKVDAVVMAGDIYDKAIPSVEAMQLLESLLISLVKAQIKVLIIAGNHDSVERLSFGNSFMEGCGVYISSRYRGSTEKVTLKDGKGVEADFYLLPFLKPSSVRDYLPEEEKSAIKCTEDAVTKAVELMAIDEKRINILVAHQTVGGFEASSAGSEDNTLSIGGSDNVNPELLQGFDYVALGHLHNAKAVADIDKIRYAGTPLTYSFSSHEAAKSMTLVEFSSKEAFTYTEIPLIPRLKVLTIENTFAEFMNPDYYNSKAVNRNDILSLVLTDEEDIPNAHLQLRSIYPNMLLMSYKRDKRLSALAVEGADNQEQKTAIELLGEFFQQVRGTNLDEEQKIYLNEIITELEGRD